MPPAPRCSSIGTRHVAAALTAGLVAVCTGPLHAQVRPSTAGPAVSMGGGLPRLLVGQPSPTMPGASSPAHGGWGWGAPEGGTSAPVHRGAPARRRVQPLVVLVSPLVTTYATSAALAACPGGDVATACPTGSEHGDDARAAVRTKVIDVAAAAGGGPSAAPDAASIAVEWLRGALFRVRWTGGAPGAREVALVVADSARRVLAAQRVQEAPYTAVFERGTRTALVGVSVVRADGSSTLTLTPLGIAPTRARH